MSSGPSRPSYYCRQPLQSLPLDRRRWLGCSFILSAILVVPFDSGWFLDLCRTLLLDCYLYSFLFLRTTALMASSSASFSSNVMLCTLSGTSIKLNGRNYLIWAKSIQVFLGAHKKIKHITQDPSDVKSAEYDDWLASDYGVIT